MKVSVIIPVYNEERVIKDCITSLMRESYKNLEIIVVEDGSNDNTSTILQEISKEFGIRVFNQKHKGAGAARNLGVKYAMGEILVFVDADMTFDKDFIKKLIEPIVKKELIGTFSKDEYLENKDNIWAQCWNLNRGLPVNRMHTNDYPDTQEVFRAIRKDSFENVGGFDEKLGYTDDWSLSRKLGFKAAIAEGAIFYHKNPSSLKEVFVQSRWMAKRNYKFGALGYLFSLVRVSLPVSLCLGIVKSIKYSKLSFLPFKIVSDAGSFIGILEFVILGKASK